MGLTEFLLIMEIYSETYKNYFYRRKVQYVRIFPKN